MTWTKLHSLCEANTKQFDMGVILRQCLVHPEEISEVDDHGHTPLHVEVIRCDGPREEVIRALLHENPKVLMKKDFHGSTPLHLALWTNTSPRIIRLMIDACLEVTFEKDKEGLMPIHVACRYCPGNEEVMMMLIGANPSGLLSRTRMGNPVQKKNWVSPSANPIEVIQHNQHIVLDGTTSSAWRASQIKSIAERRSEEHSSRQVRDGAYPLHMAIENGGPLQVLEMLAKEAPEVASKTNKFGQTCLHLAVKNGGTSSDVAGSESFKKPPATTMNAVKMISLLDTTQVKSRDIAKQVPLHIACEVGCSIDVVKFLMNAYPDAIQVVNKDGERPLDLANLFGNCSKDLIIYLSELSNAATAEVAQ